MYTPDVHNLGMHLCECHQCAKYRLVYALVVARNKDDITEKDFDLGITILTTMLSVGSNGI
jgi:hypothetical protein